MNSTFLYLVNIVTNISSMSQTASLIANSEFRYQSPISVVWWQADFNPVTNFLTSYQGSVKTVNMNEEHDQLIAFDQAVLFVTTSEEFLHAVIKLDKNISTPSKVVIILLNPKELSNITKIAWTYDITDLILLILENDSVVMYTYYPFNVNECDCTRPVKVDFKRDFFPSKYKNLFGCETRVGIIHSPPFTYVECVNGSSPFVKGLNGDMFMIIAEHLNTTVAVICIPTTTPYIAVLTNKTIHILMPVIFVPDFLAVQNSRVYHLFESVWCGPPQREIYMWATVLIPLMNNITILLAASYFMLVVTMKIIIKIESISSFHVAWKVFGIILGQTSDYESKSWMLNSLYALWLWSNMVVTIAYQGVLVEGLQVKYLEPRFDKIENAMNLVDGFGGTTVQRALYSNESIIWKRFEPMLLPEMFALLTPISRGKRYLILTTKTVLLGYSLQIFQSVNHWLMTMSMSPRWGGGLEIRSADIRLVESGFFQKFYRDQELVNRRRETLIDDGSEDETGHLDFVMLSTCFYGLAVMGLVCFIILLLEILYHWFTNKLKGGIEGRKKEVMAPSMKSCDLKNKCKIYRHR